MKYLLTADEMRRYDANTIEHIGIPGMVLMERAALEAFRVIEARLCRLETAGKRVFVLAGMGNNGGDGLALARMLCQAGYQVTVKCVGNPERASGQWRQQREILEHFPVCFQEKSADSCQNGEAPEYNILVDALFGVGLSRKVEGEYAQAIADFNNMRGLKVALDLPSGIGTDRGEVLGCAVRADVTVTFAFLKRGLVLFPGAEYAGKVVLADIGITEQAFEDLPPELFSYDEPVAELLPVRSPWGNKGTFGKVLAFAGSSGMAGAAVLSARAAYRSGAGMVKVLSPEENRQILQMAVPEALYGTRKDLEESLRWADVIVVGPGVGTDAEARHYLKRILSESGLPLLIDADGLNLLSGDEELTNLVKEQGDAGRKVILTPHVGELARLTKRPVKELKRDLPGAAKKLAAQLGAIVVAKDARTFICTGEGPVCVNLKGNCGMATAGSGDVLAGIIGGLLGQGMDAFQAACVGVYLHGYAGDRAAARVGKRACVAGDLIEIGLAGEAEV